MYVSKVVKLIETENKMEVARGRGKGKVGSCYLMGVALQSRRMRWVCGMTTCPWLTILYCTLGNSWEGDFM